LFTRPFWLDEWHLMLVAGRGSLGEVLSDLRAGSDFGPPLLHFIVWIMHRLFGTVTPAMLHTFSFLCVTGALVFVYHALRRRFDRLPSIAGALAVGSEKLVVGHAFEGRFYAPMLLFCGAFAWVLSIDPGRPTSRRRDVAVAVVSVLLCTIHWFGVLSLGLMALGAVASFGRRWREGVRRVAPAAAGVVVLLACAPLLIGQRGSIKEPTWIPDLNIGQVVDLFGFAWFAAVPMVAIAVLLIGELRSTKAAQRASIGSALREPGVAALLALALMPFLLIAISTRQPAMIARYAITALVAWGPLVALAAQSVPRAARIVAVVLLAGRITLGLGRSVGEQRTWAMQMTVGRDVLREACKLNMPVVFHTRHLLYPIAAHDRQQCPQTRILEMNNATLDALFPAGTEHVVWRRLFRLENEFSRMHDRLYGFPRVVTQAEFDTTSRFVFLGSDLSLPPGRKDMDVFGPIVFPHHTMKRLNLNLTLFERK
jgi:hypothetical protein